jgi:hypothetical protein
MGSQMAVVFSALNSGRPPFTHLNVSGTQATEQLENIVQVEN